MSPELVPSGEETGLGTYGNAMEAAVGNRESWPAQGTRPGGGSESPAGWGRAGAARTPAWTAPPVAGGPLHPLGLGPDDCCVPLRPLRERWGPLGTPGRCILRGHWRGEGARQARTPGAPGGAPSCSPSEHFPREFKSLLPPREPTSARQTAGTGPPGALPSPPGGSRVLT